MVTATGRRVRPGRRVAAGKVTRLVAREPFSVSCKRSVLSALRVFDSDLYVVPVVPCKRPRLISKRAVGVVVLKDAARARASVRIAAGKAAITVTARARVGWVVVRAGGRNLRARVRRTSKRQVILSVRRPRRTARPMQIVALIAGNRYSGLLPIARGS